MTEHGAGPTGIHPQAIVESEVGEGTRVWAFAHVMGGAQVGRDCNIGEHAFIETGAVIGDGVTVKNGAMIWEGVTVGNGAFIGPGVIFTNDRYPRSSGLPQVAHEDWLVRTEVGPGASIGAGVVIGPGAHIGAFALVAAGSVVVGPVAPHALVRGAPATPTGWVCICGLPLPLETGLVTCTCDACGRAWRARSGDGGEFLAIEEAAP